jgi:tryptophan synthase alpha chain
MTRIGTTLADLSSQGKKALTLFLTAGFPEREATRTLVPILAEAGADIVEIGMPFSDPLADGPAIQESSTTALRQGMTLAGVLSEVEAIRRATSIPLVLMGYLNPILRYGVAEFFRDAASAGIDGLILPEVPLEELGRFESHFQEHHLDRILLVTPTTTPDRIRALDKASSGFVYCVSTTGVTGATAEVMEGYLTRVRSLVTHNPLQVGFGISTPEDARRFSSYADGVIVGSALIRRMKEDHDPARLRGWVASLKAAITEATP